MPCRWPDGCRTGSAPAVWPAAALALLSALTFTFVGARTPEVVPVLATLTIGLGMGCFSAPTMGSLYRILPAPMVAQGSSGLYVLNQLGAALGIALVTLILQTSGDPISGFHSVFWLVAAMLAIVLAAIRLLQGRPDDAPAGQEEPAMSGKASS